MWFHAPPSFPFPAMNTRTDLANRALSHIGDMPISSIDEDSKPARACKEFISDVIDEVLRDHRWNCAISRVTLSRLSTPPNHGFAYAYQLPGDFLRLLELNGEQYEGSDEYFEIEEGKRLLSNADEAKVRYVRRIDVPAFDPLLAKAVSASLAAAICIPLNRDVSMQAQLEALAQRAISRARRVDAIEVGSREVRPLGRIISNSPLIQSRFRGRRYRDPLRYYLP